MASTNPWNSSDLVAGFKLGDPDSVLVLAEQHGLRGGDGYNESSSVETRPSLKLIAILREVAELQDLLNELDLEIYKNVLDQNSADLLHVDKLDAKQAKIETLLNYFTEVIKNTQRIIAILQKVSLDSSLKIDARYHKNTIDTFSILTSFINDLPKHCRLLESLKTMNFKDNSVKSLNVSQVVQSLVECKISTQRLRDHFEKRYN